MTTHGYFGIGVEHDRTAVNIGTLWRSADLLGAAFVFTVGRRYSTQSSDTMRTSRNIPLWNFTTIDDLVDHLPHSCPLVGVELDGRATSIGHFVHPERCAYLLGAEDHGMTKDTIRRCHALIRLPGRCSMNVASAGTVVLYDRYAKTHWPEGREAAT